MNEKFFCNKLTEFQVAPKKLLLLYVQKWIADFYGFLDFAETGERN
jgi:hypothetical protein